jgi:2-methylcitrate dehydratase PrpD
MSSDTEATPETESLTIEVSRFIVNQKLEDIPPSAIEAAKRSILDGLGVALSGSRAASAALIEKYISSQGNSLQEASIFGSKTKTSPRFAALANGVAMHADDFDDTYVASSNGIGVHPTVTVLPAVFALAEAGRHSGRDVLLAYHIGTEIEMRLAESVVLANTETPSHPTGTFGALGSSAACASLRRFSVTLTQQSLAIAAGMASGLRANFGTLSKPLAAGHAAENGVLATDLASIGWNGSEHILESPLGFMAREGSSYKPEFIVGRLGKPWVLSDPGVAIKPYPSGALTHPAMSEVLRLVHEHRVQPAEIESVEVSTLPAVFNTLIHHQPKTGLQAKFSLEFCISIILLQGHAGIADFTDAVVQRDDVQSMIRKISYVPVASDKAPDSQPLRTVVRIRLKNGQVVGGQSSTAKGSPQDPMSFEEVAEKFRSCAAYAGWPLRKSQSIVQLVKVLEREQDVRELASLLSPL